MKRAFTLAEILIAFAVIGIIAAITVPTLQIKYQKEHAVIQLKKAYSDLTNAVSMSVSKNGDISSWDFSLNNQEFFERYLSPYVVLSKNTVGNIKKENIVYKEISGKPETKFTLLYNESEVYNLMSGYQIFTQPFGKASQLRKTYIVDINGFRKPNQLGKDLFVLSVSKKKGVVPQNWNDEEAPGVKKTRTQLKNGPSKYRYNCNKKSRGIWCAALIMADGWQMKKDYPW